MAGVRGFSDPNVQVNPNGKTTFQQFVSQLFVLLRIMAICDKPVFMKINVFRFQKGHVKLDFRRHPLTMVHQLSGW